MIKKDINQNDILNKELLNIIDYNYLFNEKPINRIKTKPTLKNSLNQLDALKKKIQKSNLTKISEKIVFSYGNVQSPLMIVGDSPGKIDTELGKPFMSETGNLLDKMLNAIKIKRENIYTTNVVNYLIPEDKNLEQSELNSYSIFLKDHISIINPKILIVMGSLAMEIIIGKGKKISEERGKWKDVIIQNNVYKTIITFHPNYLLRKPDQKKYSWQDLKIIRREIDKKNIFI